MKIKTAFLFLAFIIFISVNLFSAELIHDYDLNDDFVDSENGNGSLTVNPATDSNGFNGNEWWWIGNDHPGGGLILLANIQDPSNYSLAFKMKFSNVSGSWKKIISFKGVSDDNGMYFYYQNLQLYPYSAQTNYLYNDNTYYDFIFTRDLSGHFRVYTVNDSSQVTLVFDEVDADTNYTTPRLVNGLYEFRLFTDDTHTTAEFSPSGSIQNLRVWNGALSEEEIAIALAEANFTADRVYAFEGATINFTDISSGNPTSWQWDFQNDGEYDSAEQNPSFVYLEEGKYDVKLKIYNEAKTDSLVKENFITILNPDSSATNIQIETIGNDISLSWEATAGVTKYLVFYSDKPNGTYYYLSTVSNETNYVHTDILSTKTKLFYTVLKVDE